MQFNLLRVESAMQLHIMIQRRYSLHSGRTQTHRGSHLDNQVTAKCDKCKEREACRDFMKRDCLNLALSVMTSRETDM